MKFRTLIRRSLRFHWRSHLGVVLGAVVGSAALIGALVVGDSVRGSLRERALEQLGKVHYSLNVQDKFFRGEVASELRARLANTTFSSFGTFVKVTELSSVLLLPASASLQDGSARANRIQVIGVDDQLTLLAFGANQLADLPDGKVIVNEALASQLNVKKGDSMVLRVRKPSAFSQEVAVSSKANDSVALRLTVLEIAPPSALANLSLVNGSAPPMNAFVNLRGLQQSLQVSNQANVILLGAVGWDTTAGVGQPLNRDGTPFVVMEAVSQVLREVWDLADYQLNTRPLPEQDCIELLTPRIFVDAQVAKDALGSTNQALSMSGLFLGERLHPRDFDYDQVLLRANQFTNAQPILTYLATLLRSGTNVTPYSMVTAAGAPWTPPDLRDDEIVVSQWLAEDLQVKPGDEIAMSYFLPESGAKLEEATNTFRVRSIVPMEMPWADRTLMPDFPGIEKAESTSDWDAGFPLTYKVRPKDDDYWKQHRGTPKAFITLAAGQKMWQNRFGDLTAIRFPIPTNFVGDEVTSLKLSPPNVVNPTNQLETPHVVSYQAALEKKILANLKPEELGLRFEPVREQALKAAEQSQDFGGLFLGFSFFLIAAALLLMAMLFQLGLEQRAPEIGTLLALGFTPKQVRRLLLGEGVALAFVGGLLGAAAGLAYARVMLHGLTTIWRDAVGASALSFHFTAQTLVVGLFASVVVSMITIWLALRKFVKLSPRELLVGETRAEESKVQSLKSKVIAIAALFAALGLVGWTVAAGDTANAGAFFGTGALVLVAGLSFASAWLSRLGGAPVSDPARRVDPPKLAGLETGAPITLASLAVRGCARRRKRSLATVAMLACGSFLIVSIGVFRLDANRDATQRSSGTGGFALIGETTMPVVHDLNSPSGRDFFALNDRDLAGVSVVPFRVRDGDEASCLNLNAAQRPRLLGVKPELMEGRFTFAKGGDWETLISTRLQPGVTASPGTENRLNGFPQRATNDTGLKPGANEIEIPAIGDANSIQWAMHKKVGDTIDYVDERGQPFKVRIVGAVANSILQGQLIIDEAEFVKRFPGESGFRMFLLEAPSNTVSQVSATLSRALRDVGLELTPAAQRLAQFNAVQNTYLGTFQVLGGLGLLLGSVGLGIVVLQNVLERRGELAVLMAVGFRKAALQRLLLIENSALLALGLALGVVAAAVAVLPALLSPSGQLPYASLALTLGAVLVNGALWTWVATRVALRGNLLAALRNE